jgi:DNA-3-methyladenine glycosylase
VLKRAFFETDLLVCAEALIGCELVWGKCAGIVVETEAYALKDDEACHTFKRQSARTFVEEQQPGAAYIYLNYGIHWLLNVLVKGGAGHGLILFRALQPTRGIDIMQKRRGLTAEKTLCSGPGRLSEALAVRGTEHGIDLCKSPARSFEPRREPVSVVTDLRIGISKATHLPWRFLLEDSPYVSVPSRKART